MKKLQYGILALLSSGCTKGVDVEPKEHPGELVLHVALAHGPNDFESGQPARVLSLSFGTEAASLVADFPGAAGLGPFDFAFWGTGMTHRGELASVHPRDAVGLDYYRNGTPAIESGYLPPYPRASIYVSKTIQGIVAIHEYACDNRRRPTRDPCVDVVFSNPDREAFADDQIAGDRPMVSPSPLVVWGSGFANPDAWGHMNAHMAPSSRYNPLRVDPGLLDFKLSGPRVSLTRAEDSLSDIAVNVKSGDQTPSYLFEFSVVWPDVSLSHHGADFDADGMVRRIWEARPNDIAEKDPSRRFLPNVDCHPDDTWRYGARLWPARWSVEFDWFTDTGHIAEMRHLMNGLLEGAYFAYEPGGEVIAQGCYRGGLPHGVFFRFGYRGTPTRRTIVELELYNMGASVARWDAPEGADILWEPCASGTGVAGNPIESATARIEDREPHPDTPWWLEQALAGVSYPLARPRNSDDLSALCRVRLEAPMSQP